MKYQMKEEQLKTLLEEVQAEVSVLLKAEKDEAEKLSKAHPGEETPAEAEPDESSTAPAPEMSAAPEGASHDESSETPAEESAESPAEESAEASAGNEAPEGNDVASEEVSPEALKEEYSKLPPEELKMHYLAAKAALMDVMGGGEEEASAPPAPPVSPEASMGAPETSPSAPPTLKGEKEMKKSEVNPEVEILKEKLAKQEASLETLVKTFSELLSKPERKAVTGLSYVPKNEETKPSLNKSEVMGKLGELAKTPSLKKSDRELINQYCLGHISVDKVEHLLK